MSDISHAGLLISTVRGATEGTDTRKSEESNWMFLFLPALPHRTGDVPALPRAHLSHS